jgi:DNA-binding NarL/FixJ family response regulator
MSRIKVCILTRDRFRYIGISDVLGKDEGLTVLEKGEVEDDIETVARFRPDVVILDVTTVKVELQNFLRACKHAYPNVKVLVIGINDKEEDIADVLLAGVSGYLNILHFGGAITAAVKGIHEGDAWIAHTVMGSLMNEVAFELKRRRHTEKNLVTEAQRKVLQLLANEGLTNKEIAANLGIEERTVEFHITSLLQKFHLSNRNQLIIYALKHNLVTLTRST